MTEDPSRRGGVRPEGYPVAFERRLRLDDGRMVRIRPILPSDAPELAEAIRTADPDTLYRRFLGAPPRVTPELLTRLTTVDYVRRFVLVALDPTTDRGVAIARYEPLAEGVAAGRVGHRAGGAARRGRGGTRHSFLRRFVSGREPAH